MSFHLECQNLFDRYLTFYRNGDASGCAACYSETAELYSSFGPPAIGRRAIEDTHAEWVTEDGAENKTLSVESAGSVGDLGWCIARFSEEPGSDGFSLNVLSRQADGGWLITRSSLTEA